MLNVNVEFFKKPYLLQVENLLKDHFDIFSKNDISQFKKDLLNYIAKEHHVAEHGLTLVVVVGAVVCGLVMYEKDELAHSSYQIKWLIVSGDKQRRGYGTRLMKEVFKKIREAGGKHVYLETSNERHNEPAKMFYKSLEFKKVGVLPDYFDPPVKLSRKLEDGILYHKTL